MGSRKATVLPLPVIAHARRSLPVIAGGIASLWIGVGRVKPRSFTPRMRSGCKPKEEKATNTPGRKEDGPDQRGRERSADQPCRVHVAHPARRNQPLARL